MSSRKSFRVGEWTVEPDLDRISRGNRQRTLRPQVMALLVYLARRERQVVHTEALLKDLWPGKFVTNATLYNCVAELRNELNDAATESDSIQTIPKKGYRLLLPVSGLDEEPRSAARRPRIAIVAVLAIIVGYFLIDYLIALVDAPSEPSTEISIAVLPFVSFTPHADDEYFADGLTEELIDTLSRLDNLKVIGRTSSFYYKDKEQNLRDIGAELDVDNILEGSVRHVDDTMRITARLVRADDGFRIWSASYDRRESDILTIQEDIGNQVASALQLTLTGDVGQIPEAYDTANPEAQTRFLIARGHVQRGRANWRHSGVDYEHLKIAHRLLEEAVELDPDFAEAWAMLVHAHWLLRDISEDRAEVAAKEDAAPAARRAVTLAPNLPQSWAALGFHLGQAALTVEARNPDETAMVRDAEAAFERALALDPESLIALESYARFRLKLGDYKAALALLDRAVALDPLSRLRQLRALALYRSGQPDAARREYLAVGHLYPDAPYEAGIAEIEFDRGHLHHGLLWTEGVEGAPHRPYAWRSLGDTGRALAAYSWAKRHGGNIGAIAELEEFLLSQDYQGLEEAAPSSAAITRFFHLKVSLYYQRKWDAAVSLVEDWPLEQWGEHNHEDLTGTGGARERQYDVSHRAALSAHAAYHAHALDQVGRHDDAASVRRWALELNERGPRTTPRFVQERHHLRLLVYASRGDKEAALSELEAMVEAGWHWLMSPGFIGYRAYSIDLGWFEDSPLLDSIRNEPKFVAAVKKVKAENAAMLAELEAGLTLEDTRQKHLD